MLWRGDAAVSAPLELTTGHRLFVAALAFSPDGRTLATGSDDRSVALWDVRTGARLARMPAGHTDTVRALAWSRDGRLASGGEDATVRLWDTRAPGPAIGMPLRYQDGSPVTALSASPDGRELTALYGTATVTWPFSPAAWSRLACTFAAGVRDRPQDVAGYAGGAGPADRCP
ncbi:WD40 repeat domain-containing protein [Streptomyces sp. NPDC051310]|uniref:WD40 repeat domain-containing protein n=1 Tax=Streptomyces sp. NPDC051310 TaxID=3365649 RepID=UPI0037ABCAE8